MEKAKPNKKIRRPLTKSEKFLLTTLGLVLLVWVSYKFVLTPQAEKLTALEASKIEYEEKIMENNNTLKKEEKINKEWETLHRERDQILSQYFPKLDQAQIIYLLNDLLEDERVDVNDMSFNRASTESFQDLQVRNMTVSLPFKGNYEGIMDIIRSLGTSPRRIAIDRLNMDRVDEDLLAGTMDLKVYSLEGIAEADPNVIYIDIANNSGDGTPFDAYDGYAGDKKDDGGSGEEEIISPDVKEGMRKELLHEFDYKSYNFIPSSTMVSGNATPSTIKKSGKYSLRFEYNILALQDENRAYIDLSNPNISIKYPPELIGTWIYSYGYSSGTLGMVFETQGGEKVEVTMAEGISWLGWSYIETHLPSDLRLYPLKLDSIYYELPYNRDDYGVMLFDKMEAFYPLNEGPGANNKSLYMFYVVQPGDTISNISERIYGTKAYKNEIMKLNEIKPGDILPVGKVLVLQRR